MGDTVVMAMRLLVLRSVEWISNEPKSDFALSIFATIIDLLREALPTVQIASLLLGIGRQVEPSCLKKLFPLPSSSLVETPDLDLPDEARQNIDLLSVEDLYVASTQKGSMSIPMSSLPLLSSRFTSLQECGDLLYHCLSTIGMNFGENSFDTCFRERAYIRDLFRFGAQLESLEETDFWGDDTIEIALPTLEPTAERKKHQSDIVETTSSVIKKPVPTSPTPKQPQTRSYSSYFIPRSILCNGRKNREERAVYEAASSFILSGFEEGEYELVVKEEAVPSQRLFDRRTGITTMLAQSFVLACLGRTDSTSSWRLGSAVALLTNNGNDIPAHSTSLAEWANLLKSNVLASELCTEEDNRGDGVELAAVLTAIKLRSKQCERALSHEGAARVLHFSILLLGRLQVDMQRNVSVAANLVLIAISAAKAGNQMSSLLEMVPNATTMHRLCSEFNMQPN